MSFFFFFCQEVNGKIDSTNTPQKKKKKKSPNKLWLYRGLCVGPFPARINELLGFLLADCFLSLFLCFVN